jgi:hypothetical protein
MRITWKDGVTTLAAASAVVLERAHYNDWGIPLVSDVRWAIIGITILAIIGFILSYMLDESHSQTWSYVANALGVIMLVLAGIGLIVGASVYVTLLMLGVVAFWVASIVRHFTASAPLTHGHI